MQGASYKICSGVKRPVTYVAYYMRKLILLHNFYPPHQNISLSAEFHQFPVSVCVGSHLGGSSLVKGSCGVTSDGAVFPKGSSQGFVLPNSTNLTRDMKSLPPISYFSCFVLSFSVFGRDKGRSGSEKHQLTKVWNRFWDWIELINIVQPTMLMY